MLFTLYPWMEGALQRVLVECTLHQWISTPTVCSCLASSRLAVKHMIYTYRRTARSKSELCSHSTTYHSYVREIVVQFHLPCKLVPAPFQLPSIYSSTRNKEIVHHSNISRQTSNTDPAYKLEQHLSC